MNSRERYFRCRKAESLVEAAEGRRWAGAGARAVLKSHLEALGDVGPWCSNGDVYISVWPQVDAMRSPGQMELSCHGTRPSPARAGTHRGEPKRAWYPVVFGGNVLYAISELLLLLSERVKISRACGFSCCSSHPYKMAIKASVW